MLVDMLFRRVDATLPLFRRARHIFRYHATLTMRYAAAIVFFSARAMPVTCCDAIADVVDTNAALLRYAAARARRAADFQYALRRR